MKNLKIYSLALFLFAGFTFVSCEKDNDELTGNKELGGELILKSESIGYVVGNGLTTNYDNMFTVYQGAEKVESIDIYNTFTTTDSKGDAIVSNKVLLRTVTLPAVNQHETLPFSVNYNQLINGLKIAGVPLSASDGTLKIGDYWTLTYVSHLNNGLIHENGHSTKIAVGTRFSGKYRAVSASYYRIGVLTYVTKDWPAQTVIESVDATTYRVLDYLGAEAFSGNTYYFTIDANDVIGYPVNRPDGTPQKGNDQPFITCITNPLDMAFVNCGTSNKVVRDNVGGKDLLYMSYGYYTAGSGPRTFYQVLEKIVE